MTSITAVKVPPKLHRVFKNISRTLFGKKDIWPYYAWTIEMTFTESLDTTFYHRFLQFLGILMGNKEKQQEVNSITSHIASSLLSTVVLYSILFQVRRRWAAEPSRNWDKTYPTTHKGEITVAYFVRYCPNIIGFFFQWVNFLNFIKL